LIPLLTAEEDRDLVRRHWADQAREKELMGSATGAYNSDRYVDYSILESESCYGMSGLCCSVVLTFFSCRFVRPTYAVTPSSVTK